jgi:hypothetical protein
MIRSPSRIVTLVAIMSALTAVAASGPVGAAAQQRNRSGPGFQGETGVPADFDRRAGRRGPSAAQEQAVQDLGASVRWNDFGTPQSLIRHGGFLATGLPADPETAAKTWLRENRALFLLSQRGVQALELLQVAPIGEGTAVLLRQRVGGLPVVAGGHIGLGIVGGKVAYVSSSLAPDGPLSGTPRLSARAALVRAAGNVGRGIDAGDISAPRRVRGWTRMRIAGFTHDGRARLVALPTPLRGFIPAYQTFLHDNDAGPLAFTHFVDARTGEVLIRIHEVDYAGEPKWETFPAYPRLDYSSADTRETWCWEPAPGCDVVIAKDAGATPFAWDVGRHESPTDTSEGNNAVSYEKWFTNDVFEVGDNFSTPRPDRVYAYAWTNQWLEERCNPDVFESPQRNDIDAAIANLFVGHNRMHDWSYRLGFTEKTFNLQEDNYKRNGKDGDPEHGNAQAGGVVGGPPGFQSRDNANQITPPDGDRPVTNMYLWQPIAAGFYAPCVDGDFDMTVIAHEYTHAISNRMVAGPDERLLGLQANAMGESWSDLVAVEILNEYGQVPVGGENPFAVGAYVTGDPVAGIRNYGMNDSPLNYSDVGYDLVGPQVHADGEIWSATNVDIRSAMNARYGSGTPAGQRACADGQVAVGSCPGNRRWVQLVFDAWLLMAFGDVTMVDARDAMLAADVMRFGGANQDLLWNAFAARGLGQGASSTGANDDQPVPGFDSPFLEEGTVVFQPTTDGGAPVEAQLFVGDYEARSTPVADTDPDTPLDDTLQMVPGTYEFLARGDGFGAQRFTLTVTAGDSVEASVDMPGNLASKHKGATATGNGINLDKLIDDTEATNWAFLGQATDAGQEEAAGKQVTVRLDPSSPSHVVDRVQVSAMLRPPDPEDPGGDTGGQSRYSALRRFRILTCQASGPVDCTRDGQFSVIFTSPANAFPAVAPRPRAPDLILRSFDVPDTGATHVRIVVLTNQCTGTPDFLGDQDDDPGNVTDCIAGSTQERNVRIAELQVFAR